MSILFTGTQAAQLGASLPFIAPPTYSGELLAMEPLIYYRMDDASGATLTDSSGNGYDAGISGIGIGYAAGSLVRGETGGASLDYAAAGFSEFTHDSDLELPAITISLWFQLNDLPDTDTSVQYILLSKDTTGLIDGDFVIAIDNDGTLYCHFQQTSPATAYRIDCPFLPAPGEAHHVAVTADSSGFALWYDGQQVATSTDWLGAWSDNERDLQLGVAGWQAGVYANAKLDEVAIFDRVLTTAEILTLARQSSPPQAAAISASVLETETVVITPLPYCQFVGLPASATVEVVSQGASGTAGVVGQMIEYTAADLGATTDVLFTYRVADQNGTSTPATCTVEVIVSAPSGSDDGFGGTLIYSWEPDSSLISGNLAARTSAIMDLDSWNDHDTVGTTPILAISGSAPSQCCFNNAPTGEPCLEFHNPSSSGGGSSMINIGLRFAAEMATNPRHVRLAAEILLCATTHDTTYKGNGKGTTSGGYPNWRDAHVIPASGGNPESYVNGKFFIGLGMGEGHTGGGGKTNWWNAYKRKATGVYAPYEFSPSFRQGLDNVNNYGVRVQFTGSNGIWKDYYYLYARSSQYGQPVASSPATSANDTGIKNVWFRIELEHHLTTPASIASNSTLRLTDPPTTPSQTGDAVVKIYVTKDIDGELGTPGTRQLVMTDSGGTTCCKFDDVNGLDNMHTLVNINRLWLNLIFGGSTGAQAEAWAWMRKLQAYHYTADDI